MTTLADLSFKLYTDSGLTTPFSGTLQITNYTDLSDNPQDFVLYLGSTISSRQLQANSNPGVDDITLTPTDNIANWATAIAKSTGDLIEPSTPNGYVYRCTTAGTTDGSTEPTWPTSGIGSTVSDGTIIWTFLGPKHTINEVKLAATSGGLSGATPGAALNLGDTILGGSGNAVEINIRITNAVTIVRNNAGHAELTLVINEVIETES